MLFRAKLILSFFLHLYLFLYNIINNHTCYFSFISPICSQIFIRKIKNIIIDIKFFYNLKINYKIF